MATPTTSSITSRYLVALLDARGRPVDDVLRAARIPRAAIAKPDVAVPLAAFAELWRRAAAVEPDIGLTMVERFGEGSMHLLVHLALRSRTIGAALEDVSRHASVTSSADRMAVGVRARTATFAYACRVASPANPWIAEHYLSMAVVFLARASGRGGLYRFVIDTYSWFDLVTRAVLPMMLAKGKGAIVSTASISSAIAGPW